MLVSTIKEELEPSSIGTNSARMAMLTSKPSKATLDDTIPRFGSVHLGKGQKFKVLCNTMEFLEMFSSQAKNIHGENFENICARLMKQAILDDDQRQRMEHRMGAMQPHELTWLKCESLFTETLMTALERDMELKVAITRGILPGESYQRYAWRLERLIRIYKVCESTSHPITLRQLKMTIPPEIFDIMTMRFIMEHALLDVNAEDVPKDITRADQFCTYLEKMTGPEDSDERKRSKVRVAEDGNTEGRQLKRQKHNTLEEDDYQGSTTLKPMYDCQNGCGKNSTHDTDGCIICGICLKRGHYAVRCPNKNRPTNNVSIGHSGQNPNRGVSGRNGYNNRGRGAYRGGSQWRGGHGTGVNTPGTIPQGEFTTADFTFTTERRGHTKEHLSNAATLVHTTEQNNHARKSLWGNTQPEGSKESARITINESNIKVSQNNNIKDDRSSQKDDSHLAMSITHAVIAVGRIPTKPGHYQNYAGRTYAAIAVHYAAFKTDHKSHSSWRGNGDVNMENDELIQDDENERAHQQLKPDYNLLVNPHSGMHAHVMHENENLHKQYSTI